MTFNDNINPNINKTYHQAKIQGATDQPTSKNSQFTNITNENRQKFLVNMAAIVQLQTLRYRATANDHPLATKTTNYTSRMAKDKNDLNYILQLRRAYFNEGIIVPDDAYWSCWQQEPASMKIVCDQRGEPVGYWSQIPVSEASYRQFLNGELSHQAMLMERVLRWEKCIGQNIYLYIVGAVVPSTKLYVSGRVLLDLCHFNIDLMQHLNLVGLFGYPTRTAGHKVLNHLGFAHNHVFVGDQQSQPILYIPDTAAHRDTIKFGISEMVRNQFKRVPIWESTDRQRFLNRIR